MITGLPFATTTNGRRILRGKNFKGKGRGETSIQKGNGNIYYAE
jgi:hypothetical protein